MRKWTFALPMSLWIWVYRRFDMGSQLWHNHRCWDIGHGFFIVLRKGDESPQTIMRIAELERFVMDIADSQYCDHREDSHKYGTPCIVCEAIKLIPKEPTNA